MKSLCIQHIVAVCRCETKTMGREKLPKDVIWIEENVEVHTRDDRF